MDNRQIKVREPSHKIKLYQKSEAGSKNLPKEYYIHKKLIIKKLYQIKKIKNLRWGIDFPSTRIRKIKGITTLTFGGHYNKETKLPQTLTTLTFESRYDKKTELPPNLTTLTFRYFYNQVTELPPNLTTLTFGSCYNQKTELPPNLTTLTFRYFYNQVTELPPNLTTLTFGSCYNQKTELPPNLTTLTFGCQKGEPHGGLSVSGIRKAFGLSGIVTTK